MSENKQISHGYTMAMAKVLRAHVLELYQIEPTLTEIPIGHITYILAFLVLHEVMEQCELESFICNYDRP